MNLAVELGVRVGTRRQSDARRGVPAGRDVCHPRLIYGNASKLVGYATHRDGPLTEITHVKIPYNCLRAWRNFEFARLTAARSIKRPGLSSTFASSNSRVDAKQTHSIPADNVSLCTASRTAALSSTVTTRAVRVRPSAVLVAALVSVTVGREQFRNAEPCLYPNPAIPGRVFLNLTFKKREQIGRYVYHCHILEHEDGGMMAPIEVLDLGQATGRSTSNDLQPSWTGRLSDLWQRMTVSQRSAEASFQRALYASICKAATH